MTDANFDEQIIEDEPLGADSEFEEAVRNATLGQFEHTLFEMWEDMLTQGVRGTESRININTANSILRSWPWIKMRELPQYLATRGRLLQEALDVLQTVYGDDKETIFRENVEDWQLHRELYIDTIIVWTRLTNYWAEEWQDIPLGKPDKGTALAAIMDITAQIMGENGYIAQMQNLYEFHISNDEGEEITRRILNEVSDE